jgi:GTP pyrophosphokinase
MENAMDRFPELHTALDYAADAHQDQPRKGTTIAYLSHLLGVASLVIEHGGSEAQAIAGLLHDVVEDCGAHREAEIRERFGDSVANMVMACTDGVPDEAGKKPEWRARKEAYLRHLREDVSHDALLVSACDKLHNARAIAADAAAGHAVFDRFTASREDTLWYYRQLLEVFETRMGSDSSLPIELRWAVERIESLR